MTNPDIPNFAAWTHENLAKFATEAYIKMQDQRALIQQLRQLIATVPHDQTPTRETNRAECL